MSTISGKSELLFMRMSSEICFHFSLPSGDFKDGLVKMARVMEASVGNADYDDDADGIGVGVLTVMLAVMLW